VGSPLDIVNDAKDFLASTSPSPGTDRRGHLIRKPSLDASQLPFAVDGRHERSATPHRLPSLGLESNRSGSRTGSQGDSRTGSRGEVRVPPMNIEDFSAMKRRDGLDSRCSDPGVRGADRERKRSNKARRHGSSSGVVSAPASRGKEAFEPQTPLNFPDAPLTEPNMDRVLRAESSPMLRRPFSPGLAASPATPGGYGASPTPGGACGASYTVPGRPPQVPRHSSSSTRSGYKTAPVGLPSSRQASCDRLVEWTPSPQKVRRPEADAGSPPRSAQSRRGGGTPGGGIRRHGSVPDLQLSQLKKSPSSSPSAVPRTAGPGSGRDSGRRHTYQSEGTTGTTEQRLDGCRDVLRTDRSGLRSDRSGLRSDRSALRSDRIAGAPPSDCTPLRSDRSQRSDLDRSANARSVAQQLNFAFVSSPPEATEQRGHFEQDQEDLETEVTLNQIKRHDAWDAEESFSQSQGNSSRSRPSNLTCTRGPKGITALSMACEAAVQATTSLGFGDTLSSPSAVRGSVMTWARGEVLGHGSLGCVFKAMDQRTGQMFAVKEVRVDAKIDSERKFREALENEVSICKELQHPHIVSYMGHDYIDSSLYIYLEYMPGGSVAQVLSQFGAFDESLMTTYARELLEGLTYLHTRSPVVLHRDIKGANILVGLDCHVKLTDFGCSKRTADTMSQSLRGSIPWMAPEVIQQTGYGRRSDVWSFGCVMIEMATARHPWGSFDNPMAAMVKIGMSDATPPLPDTVSQECQSFIGLCTQRDKMLRPHAADLLLHEFVQDPLSTTSLSDLR